MSRKIFYSVVTLCAMLLMAHPGFGANHRSAPITALDNAIGIPDVFAFRSYEEGAQDKVTFIMTADPFREPGNGPVWHLFDDNILYQIKIDNNNDAVEDIVFQFRFSTKQLLPNLFQTYAGISGGIVAPGNSPPPIPPGTPIVPDRIDSFNDAGLGQLQTYKVTMLKNRKTKKPRFKPGKPFNLENSDGSPFFVVPTNVGPRTMDYEALFEAGTYTDVEADGIHGISVFAGVVDDPFWLDLGAAFDTLNLRSTGFPAPAVLSDLQDADDTQNYAADEFSGYSVLAIAIEVPIALLTRTGQIEPQDSTAATIGIWATTSRQAVTKRRAPRPRAYDDDDDGKDDTFIRNRGRFVQLQRMGFPLINELFIGIGSKDRFSMDQPKNDRQFVRFFHDPTLARILNAATGGLVAIPSPPSNPNQPRTDLLPVFTYAFPIAAPGTPPGPIADLLRLNTGVPPTPVTEAKRLGLLADPPDPAGFPNGRRVFDDVTDVALRVVAGVLAGDTFNTFPNNRLGDGVNINDLPYPAAFPYLANGQNGRDSRHVDPDEAGCDGQGGTCPLN